MNTEPQKGTFKDYSAFKQDLYDGLHTRRAQCTTQCATILIIALDLIYISL